MIAFRTLKAVETQARAAENAASVASSNAKTTEGALLAAQRAERAYISISHHSPGVVIEDLAITKPGEEEFGGWHGVEVQFGITNHGNTPARITDIFMEHFIDVPKSIPLPPTGPGTGEHVFLVKGDAIHDTTAFQITHAQRDDIVNRTFRIWMMGYVDYIDAFDVRRRAGYARYYDPAIDAPILYETVGGKIDEAWYKRRNNLPFVTQANYNYDREREQGEGNDWDE